MVTGVMSKEGGVATVFNAEISALRGAILGSLETVPDGMAFERGP
jgi:hypothetical protein